ncbi:hypothetical protein SRHO_G00011710 [Serrasalmus rhombeus]
MCGDASEDAGGELHWRKKWKTDGSKYWVGKSWRKNKTTSRNEYEVDESSRKKKKKAAIEEDYENVGPDDTYTALNIKTSDDVYEALTTQSSAPYDVTQVTRNNGRASSTTVRKGWQAEVILMSDW